MHFLKIGCHLSISKGFFAIGQDAVNIGANTFQFFTRNPRGSRAKEIDPKDIKKFLVLSSEHGMTTLMAHAPYTLNTCSANEKTHIFAAETMADDLKRMEWLPHNLYNFHPGSHVGQGEKTGIENTIALLNSILKPDQTTTVLLETMSGKGTEIGKSFEELKQILDGIQLSDKMGICLDTCHVFSAGYDIVHDLDHVLEHFDQTIGLQRLKAIHLNDSKHPLASHKDRHEKIGQGHIGLAAFTNIINHPSLRTLPFYLETPNDLMGHAKEIKLLKNLFKTV